MTDHIFPDDATVAKVYDHLDFSRGVQAFLSALPGASAEASAIEALQTLVSEGLVAADTGDQIYAQAFAAAQLDDQIDALYDGRGSAGDPTIAKAPIAEALGAAEAKLAAFASGSETAPARSLESAAATGAPASKGVAGLDGGFVYKPRSESDGHLVILLPEGLTGEITSLVLRDRVAYLVCTTEGTPVVRSLRLHRMQSARVTERARTVPADFDLDAFVAGGGAGYRTGDASIALELRVAEDVVHTLEETPLSHDQRITPLPDGCYRVLAHGADTLDLRGFLKSYGELVDVVKPHWLRAEMAEVAAQLSELYRDAPRPPASVRPSEVPTSARRPLARSPAPRQHEKKRKRR